MKPVLINAYLYWVEGDYILENTKIWDERKISFTEGRFLTGTERKQADDCLRWDADKKRVQDFLKRHKIAL